jgi:hypothetical protein
MSTASQVVASHTGNGANFTSSCPVCSFRLSPTNRYKCEICSSKTTVLKSLLENYDELLSEPEFTEALTLTLIIEDSLGELQFAAGHMEGVFDQAPACKSAIRTRSQLTDSIREDQHRRARSSLQTYEFQLPEKIPGSAMYTVVAPFIHKRERFVATLLFTPR